MKNILKNASEAFLLYIIHLNFLSSMYFILLLKHKQISSSDYSLYSSFYIWKHHLNTLNYLNPVLIYTE